MQNTKLEIELTEGDNKVTLLVDVTESFSPSTMSEKLLEDLTLEEFDIASDAPKGSLVYKKYTKVEDPENKDTYITEIKDIELVYLASFNVDNIKVSYDIYFIPEDNKVIFINGLAYLDAELLNKQTVNLSGKYLGAENNKSGEFMKTNFGKGNAITYKSQPSGGAVKGYYLNTNNKQSYRGYRETMPDGKNNLGRNIGYSVAIELDTSLIEDNRVNYIYPVNGNTLGGAFISSKPKKLFIFV